MKELVVISGKGGTGKTSISAALAALFESTVLCDCDVDAADLHLVLGAEIVSREPFVSGNEARVVSEACSACGRCRELCRFQAIEMNGEGGRALIKAHACEGCGLCVRFCPHSAIDFTPRLCGESYISKTRLGSMSHARLFAGAENSGKLVSLVRKKARELAEKEQAEWLIADGPPGIACPVIAAITGADAVLLVAEPSLSAQHDLERVAQLCRHFGIRAFCLINRCDINTKLTDIMVESIEKQGVGVIGRIPFDPDFTRAQVLGLSLPESGSKGPALQAVMRVKDQLLSVLSAL